MLYCIPHICFYSTDLGWLNHRKGRMSRYTNDNSLCTEMIGCVDFEKLDHLRQLRLVEMCAYIRKRLAELSLKYSLQQTVPLPNNVDIGILISKSITFTQYRAFIRSVFTYLFPFDLLGECNMRSAVNHISSTLFELGYGENVRLSEFFSMPFRTSALKWLKSVPSKNLCFIYRRILFWLLNFAVRITRAAFYVTPENRTRRLLFYRKDVWKRIENHSFCMLCEKRDVRKVKGTKRIVGARVRFLPKNTVTRPLMVFTGTKPFKYYSSTALKITSAIIDQICAEQRSNPDELPITGAAVWKGTCNFTKRFRKFIHTNKWSRIYAVKTDVKECFDCINQKLLFSILQKIISRKRHYQLDANLLRSLHVPFAQRYFGCEIPSHNQNPEQICVTGETVMQQLKIYAIGKEFQFRNRMYRAYRGIPQGNHASTRLCNLYLGAADCERYPEMLKSSDTLLIRYVDDYLLLTTDLNTALKFLKVMHFGVDDSYDIIADSTKTVVNFYCERNGMLLTGKMIGPRGAIPWCGYAVYPGLRKYCIDWSRLHVTKAYSCRIVHRMCTREKRIALLKFVKNSLVEKYRVIQRFPPSRWKVRMLRKLAIFGTKLYADPYAKKLRLSRKGRWNRLFWKNLRAWIRQGFQYRYTTKLAHIWLKSSS